MSLKKKIVFITGATASGKTDFAHKLLDLYFKDAVILSVDSMQVYKYMDIGSAKPSKKEIEKYKYKMLDIISPKENFTVKDYIDKTSISLKDTNSLIFAVGGTGLYVTSLINGIFDEEANSGKDSHKIREALTKRFEEEGVQSLYKTLSEVDKECADVIDRYNPRRLIRALEVYYKTGCKFSEIKKLRNPPFNMEYIGFNINIERDTLYENINRRVHKMFENNLLEEVKSLIDMGVKKENTSMQGIGYKECYDYLNGDIFTKDEIIELIKKRTRNYAKRQITWFKKESFNNISKDDLETVVKEIELFLKK